MQWYWRAVVQWCIGYLGYKELFASVDVDQRAQYVVVAPRLRRLCKVARKGVSITLSIISCLQITLSIDSITLVYNS